MTPHALHSVRAIGEARGPRESNLPPRCLRSGACMPSGVPPNEP